MRLGCRLFLIGALLILGGNGAATAFDADHRWADTSLETAVVRSDSSESLPPSAYSPRYVSRRWTTDNGLPNNSVQAVEQDDEGFLWVGTLDGLARFDGHSFTTYDAATTDALVSNRVRVIECATDGTLWIGTQSGVSRFRDGQYRRIEGPGNIQSIDEGPDRTIWLGGESGLYRSTGNGVTAISLPDSLADPKIHVRAVEGVGTDSAWVVANHHLLFYHDGTFEQRYSSYEGAGYPLRIASTSEGLLWLATPSHLLALQDGEQTRYPHEGGVPKSMHVGSSGSIWTTTTSGLLQLTDSSVQQVQVDGAIPNALRGLHRDADGQWWIGTYNEGLIRLRPRLFGHVGVGPNESMAIHGVYLDDLDRVWAGTYFNGLVQVTDTGPSRWTEENGFPHNLVWAAQQDATGALWVGGKRLLRRQGQHFENAHTLEGNVVKHTRALHRDSTGTLWIGTHGNGLYRYRQGRVTEVLSPDRLSVSVLDLHRTGDGALWIGTKSKGVARYVADSLLGTNSFEGTDSVPMNDSLTWYDTDDGVPYKNVRDVHETPDGTLWISTYGGGIARFEGDRFTPVTPEDGLPSGTIHTIHEAPQGIFWMTSNDGVFRVPRAQVEAVADGRRDRLYAQTFDETDGMPVRECNGNFQPAITQTSSGRLWMPTMEGLTTVDPQDPRLAVPDSMPVRVTAVRADGRPRSLDSLRFAPSTYRVLLDFTAVTLRHADDLSFRYRLDEEAWTPARGRRTAEFTNLGAGTHRFTVQATIDGETWYTLDAPLRLTVAPHFYETGWFRLLVVLGVLGLVGAAYLWRTRALRRRKEKLQEMVKQRTEQLAQEKHRTEQQAERLEAIDEEKSRFFANISHELRTPLTILQGTLQDLLNEAFGSVSPAVQRQHELMKSNVDRLHRLTEQLLDLARLDTAEPELHPEPRDLVALLRRITRSYVPLAERRSLTLQMDTAVDEHPCRVDPDKLEKIVGNLLTNALQNTPEGGDVRVQLDVEEGDPPKTVLRVVDTGRGIPPEKQDELFERFAHAEAPTSDREGTGIGLALAREYVELQDGTITLDSTPGEGSTFTVRLPLPPVDPEAVKSEAPSGGEGRPPMVPAETPPSPSGDGAPGDDDRPLLLIAEDNDDVRAYLRRHLSDAYRLVEATTGEEGISKAMETNPDLILADLMMPEVGGIELCRRIRDEEDLAHTPLVMLTARAAEEDAVAGLEAGADAYVTKPFSIDALKARFRRLLEARRTGDASEALLAADRDVQSADEAFLDRVTDAIEEHLSRSNFTVEDLADAVGLSPRQLRRKLKRLTDHTPAAFIRRYRLDAAAQLLKGEAGTVAEVAYEVGFGTPETFASRFEERFGCPPSAYPEEASTPAASE